MSYSVESITCTIDQIDVKPIKSVPKVPGDL